MNSIHHPSRLKSVVLIAVLPPHFNTSRHRKPILTVSTGMPQCKDYYEKTNPFRPPGGGLEPLRY